MHRVGCRTPHTTACATRDRTLAERTCVCCVVLLLCAGSGLLQRVSAVLGSKVAAVLVPMELKLQEEGVTITG
jgi:hypothetical protein